MLMLPATGVDKSKWIVLMSCISILPLTLIEYYFIRERITEEVADRSAQSIPLCQQLKEVLTGRY